MNLFKFLSFTCVVSIFSCGQRSSKISESINNQSLDTLTHAFDNKKIDTISAFETYLISYGLTNLSEIDKSIQVDLKYASKDNFVGIPLYGDIQHAYLQQEVGLMLKEAQQYLKEYDSTLSIIVYDATRPHSVQQVMWDSCKMPFEDKTKFLSNPKNSSVHNYRAAVDVSIFDMKKNICT